METEEAPATLLGTRTPPPAGDEPEPKKKRTCGFRSGVWSHFLRATDGQSSKCMHCSSLIRTKEGSTTGLLVHLKAKHNINARKQLTKTTRKDVEVVSPEIDEESIEQEEFHLDAENGSQTVKETRTATKSKSGIQVKKEAILEQPRDEDDLLSVQIDEGMRLGDERIHESYERADDQEITLSSLQDKSNHELMDIVLHLQYKCQATEIECQRVKTKLALLRLSHCQSRPHSSIQIKNGRIQPEAARRSNDVRGAMSKASEDDDDSDYSPKA